MRRIRAGQTFWTVDRNKQIKAYCVLDSWYSNQGGIVVRALTVDDDDKTVKVNVEINKNGLVCKQMDRDYFDFTSKPMLMLSKVYWSRRTALNKHREGRSYILIEDHNRWQVVDTLAQRGMLNRLIPFHKFDVVKHQMRLIDKMVLNNERAVTDPKRYKVEVDHFGRYISKEA